MRKIVLIIPLLLFFHWFDPFAMLVERGNRAYAESQYRKALDYYLRALSKRDIPEIHYNIGCARYMLGEYKEAEQEIKKYLENRHDYRAVFNLGNIYFRQGKYQEAIEQYKQTLIHNPFFMPAKINLELALRKIEEKEAPSQSPVPDVIMDFLKKKEKEVFRKRWKSKGKSVQKDW